MPFQKGCIPWNKGRPHPISTREKMSASAKLRKPTFLGKHHTEETKLKLSKKRLGVTSWNKGMKTPLETRQKQRLAKLGIRGEKHWNWKGGKGTQRHLLMQQDDYVQWRSLVFERDGYTCQKCSAKGVYLMAHHLKSWAKYPGLRYALDNGVALCKNCHAMIDVYYQKFVYKEIGGKVG